MKIFVEVYVEWKDPNYRYKKHIFPIDLENPVESLENQLGRAFENAKKTGINRKQPSFQFERGWISHPSTGAKPLVGMEKERFNLNDEMSEDAQDSFKESLEKTAILVKEVNKSPSEMGKLLAYSYFLAKSNAGLDYSYEDFIATLIEEISLLKENANEEAEANDSQAEMNDESPKP